MSDLKKAELYIQQTCKKYFVELEDLKSQRYAGGLGDIKREIINTLYHDHKLTQKEIARIFGKSENAIWVMLQNKTKKKPVKTVDKSQACIEDKPQEKQESDGVMEAQAPEYTHTLPDLSHITQKDTAPPDMKVVCFSFQDHPDLHDYLLKTARANFRKPEDHILYLINEEREGTDEYNEALQAGKKEL